MARRLSTAQGLATIGTAIVLGTGVGSVAHRLQPAPSATGRAGPARSAPSGSTASGPASPATHASDGSGFLGPGDVLAPADFAAVGWSDVAVESEGSGEPQFAYTCQRRSLGATGLPVGTISVSWTRRGQLSGAETVALLTNAPQARTLEATIGRWYRRCGTGGARLPSAPVRRVTGGTGPRSSGVAHVWRLGDGARPAYGIVARAGDRVGLVDVYSDAGAPDPAGLAGLARAALDRIG